MRGKSWEFGDLLTKTNDRCEHFFIWSVMIFYKLVDSYASIPPHTYWQQPELYTLKIIQDSHAKVMSNLPKY